MPSHWLMKKQMLELVEIMMSCVGDLQRRYLASYGPETAVRADLTARLTMVGEKMLVTNVSH